MKKMPLVSMALISVFAAASLSFAANEFQMSGNYHECGLVTVGC